MATPVVLELMGAPGSGKTTMARRLEDEPGIVVVKDHETGDLPALLRGVLVAHPVLGASPVEGVSRVRWAAWAGRVTAAADIVERRVDAGAQVVVLDQGPAYTLTRMAPVRRSHAAATWWDHRLRCWADLLAGVVLLDADADVLLERIRARPKHHAHRALLRYGRNTRCARRPSRRRNEESRTSAGADGCSPAGADIGLLDPTISAPGWRRPASPAARQDGGHGPADEPRGLPARGS